MLEASRLGEQLAYVSARKVVMIIIILSAVLPFYVDEESHVLAQRVGMLQLSLQGARGASADQLRSSLVALNQPEEFEVLFLRVNGTVLVDNPSERDRLRCDELSQVSVSTEFGQEDLGIFGNENVLNSRSVFNVLYICLVLLVLMVSTVLFNRDTRKYVVKPMMRVIKVINELRTRVAETVLSFDETGWDPAHVERTVYDMALWIETQQARNLLPTSEEKRLEALQRAQRRAEERQNAAALAASRVQTPTKGGSVARSPASMRGGSAVRPPARKDGGGGGSLVIFGNRKAAANSDIRRQQSEQHHRPGAGASGGSTIFASAQAGLRRLWREARGVDSDDDDEMERQPSPGDSPLPSPRHSAVASETDMTVQSAPTGGSFVLRRRRSMSAGAASEARRSASRRSKRHIIEEIPLPMVQQEGGTDSSAAGTRGTAGQAATVSGGGGSLVLASKASMRSMRAMLPTQEQGVDQHAHTQAALASARSPGDVVLNPAGDAAYSPVTPLEGGGGGASPRHAALSSSAGGSIILYSDGSYALKSPGTQPQPTSFELAPPALTTQAQHAGDGGSVASSSQGGGSRSGTTILQAALAGGRMGDARTQRALAGGSSGGVVAHGRYGRRASIDHKLLNKFYSQRLAEMQGGRMTGGPAAAAAVDSAEGGGSVISRRSAGGATASSTPSNGGRGRPPRPKPQPAGGSLILEPSRLLDRSSASVASSQSRRSGGSRSKAAAAGHQAEADAADNTSEATHITPLSDDDEEEARVHGGGKAAPSGTSSLVLFSERQLQGAEDGEQRRTASSASKAAAPVGRRGRAGSSSLADEHDIAKYYQGGEGQHDEDEIVHGDSYGSMVGYLQDEQSAVSPVGGAGGVGFVGAADDLEAYLQSAGVHSVGSGGDSSDEGEVHITLEEDELQEHAQHAHDSSRHSLSVSTGLPAATAGGGGEWRSPWSLTADEEAAVDAAQTARYREALKEVMKSAALRGEDLGSAIQRKQRK